MEIRRLCLNIDKREHDKIKIFCIENGITMTAFILEAMREKMEKKTKEAKKLIH